MSASAPEQAFIDKWLATESWHRLLLVFEPSATRPLRTLLECIGFELRQAALTGSDPRVVGIKLDWWMQEWAQRADGSARHPLSRALPATGDPAQAELGQRWVAAAAGLASDDSEADLDGVLARWRHFADAQARLSALWLPVAAPVATTLHAFALAAEQLPKAAAELERGRLPVPLSVLARHGLTRGRLRDDAAAAAIAIGEHARSLLERRPVPDSSAEGYRRRQAALAQLRLRGAVGDPARVWAGERRLPPLRALWAAWRGR